MKTMQKMIRAGLMMLAAACAPAAAAFDTPAMGWSSWNTYRVNISDSLICRQADAMLARGLRDAGYTYINIDDGFFGGRDADGRLRIHPVRFPSGLKPVVDHIHSLGFKAGIYSDAGMSTCGSYWDNDSAGRGSGLYGHDLDDARFFFNDCGFDFIKIDFCGGDPKQNADGLDLDERERYTAIRRAIDSVGRPDVRVNVCRWAFPGTWAADVSQSWRIAADIAPRWGSIKRIIAANRYLSAYATGGVFNDMDMLEIGRGLSEAEERTHFGMWCMLSSPLLIGCDMTTIPASSLALITNPRLIALNQDTLALQARIVKVADGGVSLYVKDVGALNGTRRAVAVYNPGDSARTFVLRPADVDLAGTVAVTDLFTGRRLPDIVSGETGISVGPHDTAILMLDAERRNERTVYEAETAWLERYQELGFNPETGYAVYADSAACSGGACVRWLGAHPDNRLEWRDVFSDRGGDYYLALRYLPGKADGAVTVTVNSGDPQPLALPASDSGATTATMRVRLAKGRNTVRLSNPDAFVPDIDVMTLTRAE